MILVTENSHTVHNDRGSYIRRSNKTLSLGNREAHSGPQNDWQEVRNSICVGGRQSEKARKGPYFRVETVLEVVLKIEWFGNGVMSVNFDTSNNESTFLRSQEGPRLSGQFWKVDNQ